jgi:hypothetical protein
VKFCVGFDALRHPFQLPAQIPLQLPTWIIELASLSDPVLVPFTIGSTLGLREEPGLALITTLMDWLKDK